MKKLSVFILFVIISFIPEAFAANWYVDNAASGTNAGTSWTNAWESFGDISWGSISAGDTVYISGGSSSKTYNELLDVDASGTNGNNIVIQTGQTAGHNGTVIIDGQDTRYNCILPADYTTISGNVGGNRRMLVRNSSPGTGIFNGDADGIVITYVEVDDCGGDGAAGDFWHGIRLGGANGCEVSYCYIHDNYGDAFNAGGSGSSDHNNSFHHNLVLDNSDDGFQVSGGWDIYNNIIGDCYVRAGGDPGGHPDGIQTQGSYIRVYNNEIYNCSTHAIFIDPCCGVGVTEHLYVYNNVVYQNQAGYDRGQLGQGIKVKQEDPQSTSLNYVVVANNTVVDLPRNAVSLECQNEGNFLGDIIYANNLVYNTRTGGTTGYVMGTENFTGDAGTWDYNLVNAGLSGGTNMWWQEVVYTYAQFVSNGYGQSHGQTGAPSFVSYSEFSPNKDLRLQSSDTACRGNGMNLSSYFTTDKDGNARTSWDIGAYEYGGSTPPAVPPIAPQNLKIID